ncbi:MAG TPA: hypothetical protein VEK39_01170 [Solirubrobacterales bacterium]|nr:hypothetical protein [Solirubrobacterales bacterium]
MTQDRVHANRVAHIAIGVCVGVALLMIGLVGSASARDVNSDHIPDQWEKHYDLSLKVNQAKRDQDGDQMRNRAEYHAGTNPRDADSDGDGVADVDENAGEVSSFEPGTEEGTGTLVIDLYAGGTLSGEVSAETRIICAPEGDEEQTAMFAPQPPAEGTGPSGTSQQPPEGGALPSGDGEHNCPEGTECSTDDLVPGTIVHEATVEVSANGNEFEKVVLGS